MMCSLYWKTFTIFFIVMVSDSSYCLKNRGSDCPQMYERTYEGYIPKGNDTAGTYILFENITDIEDCISKCCNDETCNAALIFNKRCYNIDCKSNDMCLPQLHHNPKLRDNVTMVLVRPDLRNETWVNILKPQDIKHENWKESCPKLYEYTYKGYLPKGNVSTGNFSYIDGITNFKQCILNCCDNDKCNVAIMYARKCYNVACKSSKSCIPILHHNATIRASLKLVLVKPVGRREQWKEILNKLNESEEEEDNEELLPEISSRDEITTTPTITWIPVKKLSGINLQLPDLGNKLKRETPSKKFKIEWTQKEGPTKLEFLKNNETSFDMKNISAGNYLIRLSIAEENIGNSVNITDYLKIEKTSESTPETITFSKAIWKKTND